MYLIKIYKSIEINLGIKKKLNKAFNIEKTIKKIDEQILRPFYIFLEKLFVVNIDNIILYPIYDNLRKYFFKRIVRYYGADYHWNDQKSQNLDKETSNFGYGQIHYSLIRSQRPKNILCVGSMYGFIPYMMAKACGENNFGHVDFVDASYDINDTKDKNDHFYGQGFWKKNNPKKHFSYLGSGNFISTYVMTTEDFAKRYPNRKYNYIYLDGDHSYKGALINLKLFWSKLNQDGYLCFHDIHFDRIVKNVSFEHGKVWESLSEMPYKIEISNHYSGIGFIQKIGTKNPLKKLNKKRNK